MDSELQELGELVDRALAIADRLALRRVGIALDAARVDLCRRGMEAAPHETVQ